MKPSHLTNLLALFFVQALAGLVFAAVPSTINYQGYLKSTAGTPVNTATSIRFSLYSSNPARNNPVWFDTHSVTPQSGIYSAQLGSQKAITAPFDVPYWLGIKVAGDAEMALQALSSVPYAKRAGSVDAGTQTLLTGAAANKGLIVKGVSGQTANLQEWQSSTGSAVASVSPAGDLTLKGNMTLPHTTETTGMIKSDNRTLIHTYGGDANFFAGVLAGNLTMSGSSNTGVGNAALMFNTNGYDNTATGTLALQGNTSGYDNTATGSQALVSNSGGNYNTANGSMALHGNTTGAQNTATGFAALFYNTIGYQNTANGESALLYNSVGHQNTADGFNALYSNTTANRNTAIGYSALYTQAFDNGGTNWDSYNTAVGYNALYANAPSATSNGTYNSALGSQALVQNTTGMSNTASGAGALYGNTTGSNNTAVGRRAGFTTTLGNANTTGSNNTFIGTNSGPGVSTQLTNATAIGYGALVNQSDSLVLGAAGVKVGIGTPTPNEQLELTGNMRLPSTTATAGIIKSGTNTLIHTFGGDTNFFAGVQAGNLTMGGSKNTAIGASALEGNTTGYDNTANGFDALHSNSTGYENTANGTDALANNTTASQNTAIGTNALSAQSYNNGGTAWASYNTAVGWNALRSNQPTSTLTGTANTAVGANSLSSNTTGYFNTASGVGALLQNTTGTYNTASGTASLNANTTGTNNVAFGSQAGYTRNPANANTFGNNNTFVGVFSGPGTSTQLNNATVIGYDALVDASNHVRIGNTSITQIGGQVGWSNLSDRREKEVIADIPYGLDFIRSLKPVEFRLKGGNQRLDFGFLAQDIEGLVGTGYNILGIGATEERKLSLRYTDFIAPMVKAMQEQQAIIDQLKAELAELRKLLGK